MDSVKEKLDEIEERIMGGLKDFQRATVERIAELYRNKINRVLVSDEVGLGKTLIARGTIAKFAQLRKEEGDDLVKVVYVCSNSAIAEQNLNKLKITDELTTDGISDSRLSMQHLKIAMQESDTEVKKNYIQLIPLTPHTSFHISNSEGTVNERALMYAVLRRIPSLAPYLNKLEELMVCYAKKAWKDWCKNWYEGQVVDCDKKSGGKYLSDICVAVERELNLKQASGFTLYEELLQYFNGTYASSKTSIIVKLRTVFAKISIDKLKPDLVIMDEFQRFKDLLTADRESETGMLANKFFSDSETRMLLLSATPYKMYSTFDEIEEENADEHYEEFLGVLKFLNMTDEADEQFRQIWSDYSVQLKEYASGSQAVLQAKNNAENALYSHICRTERMEAEGSADIVDDSAVQTSLDISGADISSYIQMSKLLDGVVKYSVPSDYVKSCPYLLSFMRDYKLKRDIEAYFKAHPDDVRYVDKPTFFIKKKTLAEYEKIPCNNARLESVMARSLEKGAELLLWIPPSKSYYTPTYPFTNAQNFTKTLIFSSWEMVPRMIASLLSYEVERKTIAPLAKKEGRDIGYFVNDSDDDTEESNKRRYPLPKLNFALKDGEPATMSLFCLVYPSRFLAECYNPVDCLNRGLSLKEITQEVKQKISEELTKLEDPDSGAEDKSWYYVAPLLFDGGEYCLDYTLKLSESITSDEEEKRNKGYIKHLQKLLQISENILKGNPLGLGKRPADLVDVLADMAIASPAICAYRSFNNYFNKFNVAYSSLIAKAFVNRMNTPESTAIVELCFGVKNEEAYWQNVLNYCKAGNFQAMLDEYVHLLTNGVSGRGDKASSIVQRDILQSLNIRTTKYNIDTFNSFKARMNCKKEKNVAFRSHFAVAFTRGDGNNKDTDRKKTLRNAFNSPFRPFVLASTSIGQEGLDFHNYCRRIVHWNLPSNPIDLEQREGRINRYECLAIRQNIAKRYGDIAFKSNVWREMFAKAKEVECTEQTSELVPYWGLTEQPEMVKIERIVPMYPFSRDELSYERLMKILNLYRLTLGQARQEELLEYIMQNREDNADLKEWFINLSPYYKERRE